MSEKFIEIIKQKIITRHQGDERQLDVIFSESKRILVEAPAGYGKTNTMISKIAYMIACKKIPNPKKLLALTFSVNGAYKIKKDVAQQIPGLLENAEIEININDKVFISNYHGFCRNLLKKHGHMLHTSLREADKLQSIDDSQIRPLTEAIVGLSFEDAKFLSDYSDALKNNNENFLEQNFEQYCSLVIAYILPKGYITYNGILTLSIKLFESHPSILKFYQDYFNTVLVDEYQDTNILSFWLVSCLVTDSTNLIFLGDTLQRIYGFIGAVPGLLSFSESEFKMTKIELAKNYRFASNPQMLLLDQNLRRNATNPSSPIIEKDVSLDLILQENQPKEALEVIRKAVSLREENQNSKIAILVKQRGNNVNVIIETFALNKISFFNGLFSDEDVQYISFHRKCLHNFLELIKLKDIVSKRTGKLHLESISKYYKDSTITMIPSLLNLLQIFWEKLFIDFSFLSNEEKFTLVRETFENNGLKQYIEFVNSNIVLSTVHGAKGLEWDFVILPDMEQDSFPNWHGMCSTCTCKADCKLVVNSTNEKRFLEELSVFYVAVTRARKQVFFSASQSAPDVNGKYREKKISCFLSIPGITINVTQPQ